MAAFFPILFVGGDRGAVFAQIPAVIIPALIFSLVESKLILPSHMKWLRKQNKAEAGNGRLARFQNRISGSLTLFARRYYRPFLALCIRKRYLTLSAFASVLILMLALVASGWLRFIFFPRVQGEEIEINYEMPAGTPRHILEDYTGRIEAAAQQLRDKYIDPQTGKSIVKHILATSGGRFNSNNEGSNGQVVFEVEAPEKRSLDIDSTGLLNEWRTLVGPLPGAEAVNYLAELGRLGFPVDLKISALDLDQLGLAVTELKDFLLGWPGVFSVSDDFADGKQEFQIILKPEAFLYGLSRQNIARQVRQAIFGYEAERIQRGRNDIRVKVRHPLSERRSVADIRQMLINTAEGGAVPLDQIADLHPAQGATKITRIDGLRTISITADLDKQRVNVQKLQRQLRQKTAGNQIAHA